MLSPPARIVYWLIAADAELAAELVIAVDQLWEGDAAIESLAYFAYDKSRSEKFPGLSISLRRNGDFLQELLKRKGDAWLKAGLQTWLPCTAKGSPRRKWRLISLSNIEKHFLLLPLLWILMRARH